MNNNIIKSLRRSLFCTVAAAVVTIGFTACADDSLVTQNTPAPANVGGYKLSIPANMGGGGTRAIAYNSETGGYDAMFETTDRIFIYDVTKNAEGIEKTEWGWNIASLNPDANGKTANLCGVIDGFRSWNSGEDVKPEIGDELMLFYNTDGTYLNYNRYYTGDWYYNSDIADYAIASVKITSIDGGVIKTEPSSFWNPQSIYKINFKGIGSDVKIKKVTIGSEQRKLVSYYRPTDVGWPNEFGNVTYIYKEEGIAQDDLIFLLRFADNSNDDQETESTSGDVITFMALGSDGHYYKGTKSVTTDLENGKYYQAEVAMEDAGLAMTLTNNTTGESVILSDEWTQISTKEDGYAVTNTAINNSLEWLGGDQALTLKGVSVNSNNYSAFIDARSDYDDPDNTKVHKLVLDGVNTLNTGLRIGNSYNSSDSDCSLIVSALSGGKLDITSGGIYLGTNATMTIESGEVSVDYLSWDGESCSVILSGDAKLRVRGSYGFIKGASGYVINTTTDGEYTVYTVTAAPPYEDPIALSAATTADIGKIVGSDGNVHVLYWALPEGVSPVGMLASISSTGHGLAIAKEIQVKKSYEWGGYDIYKYFSWGDSYWTNEGKTATEIFNDWAAENSVGFGEWRIPTKADCQNMILSCRIAGDATEPSDENMVANGFVSKLTEVGIYDNEMFCWTGTPVDDEWMFTMRVVGNSDEGSAIVYFYNTEITGDNTASINPVLEF